MNALFCQKAKLGAVVALLNDSLAAKSLNPRPQGQGITIWLGLRTRVRFRVPPPIPKIPTPIGWDFFALKGM